jgi:biopolymer transport protein ExbB
LNLNVEILHNSVFYVLYGLAFLATAVFVERLLYFIFTFPAEKKLLKKELEITDERRVELLFVKYAERLERGKGILLFTITGAPLLGLLGTVLGIMESFTTMAQMGVSDVAQVSKGIAYALEATALGIAVALFALTYYYLLNGLIKRGKGELRKLALKATSRQES